jgi:glycosyltransferase involved in cell wall biosynthesis
MLIEIWHELLWTKYKGAVFTSLYALARSQGVNIRFFQVAGSSNEIQMLGAPDLSYHQYPFDLLFESNYEDVPWYRRWFVYFANAWKTEADFVIIPGYYRFEHWVHLLALIIQKRPHGVFCDSTAYDQPRTAIKSLAKAFFFRNCDAVFCYGVRSKGYVLSHAPNAKVFALCQAAALPHDYDVEDAIFCRQAFVSPCPSYLFVGRLIQEKNLELLLEGFAMAKRTIPSAMLRIVGDGPERSRLEARAKSLAISDCVKFAGPLSGVALFKEYSAATCLVLPSLSEAWGLVANEALSYGCPVLVSDRCGCVPELVIAGRTGFTFDPMSVKDLTEKLELAVRRFADRLATAQDCVEVVSRFSPEAAAANILAGCLTTKCL